jgi:hypothetical protein
MPKRIAQRRALVRSINAAFDPKSIRQTAGRLRGLRARGDFLDITDALGFLQPFTDGNLASYRRALTIPRHVRRVLTLAFRTALFHAPDPIPLHIAIVAGKTEGVRLTVTDRRIEIVLSRADRPT